MNQRIRITTRANQFEQRKQEHLQAGYLIEDEQPFPMNGFCSFTAVRIVADEALGDLTLFDRQLPSAGGRRCQVSAGTIRVAQDYISQHGRKIYGLWSEQRRRHEGYTIVPWTAASAS